MLSTSCGYVDLILSCLSVLEVLIFLIPFYWRPHDARAFATKGCGPLGVEFFTFCYLPLMVLHARGMIGLMLRLQLTVVTYIIAGGFIIVLSALHVDGILRYAYKGRAIVQLLVAPRYQRCFRWSEVVDAAAAEDTSHP